jgi:hypothetical protein
MKRYSPGGTTAPGHYKGGALCPANTFDITLCAHTGMQCSLWSAGTRIRTDDCCFPKAPAFCRRALFE